MVEKIRRHRLFGDEGCLAGSLLLPGKPVRRVVPSRSPEPRSIVYN